MNRYKNLKCECGKKATSANGKAKKCPACGKTMAVADNWYLRYEHNGKSYTEASTTRLCDVEERMAVIKLELAAGRTGQKEHPVMWVDAVRLFQQYNKEHKLAVSTQKFYDFSLKTLAKSFGGMALQDITKQHVTKYRTDRLKTVCATTINLELTGLKRLFAVAMDEYSGRVYKELHISGAEIARISDIPQIAKTRCLSMVEIKLLWENMSVLSDKAQRALKLILLTGQRPGEVSGICTEEIDGRWWTIPANRAKNGIANRVWLSDEAMKLVQDINITRAYVSGSIASRREGEKALGIDYFTPHDLRRTMATQLAQMEVSDEVIDAILNHKKQGIIKVYNTYKYDTQKQAALEAWGEKLRSFLDSKIGHVISISDGSSYGFLTGRSVTNENERKLKNKSAM